ncbi:hypothetical protein [uncultured Gemella sp.]|uniref:hypothetical protein n=1 Tax=uncultured Gemella sp. TaxID=254352 RepID=UPI0028D22EBF|nr:hypothetical protein [uncultured Gemella sp.]
MTNEELEQKVKRLEEQLTEVRIELLERKADKKPYEVKVPEDIDDYYYVDADGLIESLISYSDGVQKSIFERGLAFKTRKEAEQFDKERILINKLKNWAKKHQGDWTPNWDNLDEEKRSIMYDNGYKKLEIFKNYRYQEIIKLPYFKSEKITEQFIEEFGDEIKEVLY